MSRFGWVPDFPDLRDYRFAAPHAPTSIKRHSNRAGQSPVRDQRDLGACTGFAVTGAIEYLRRADLDLYSTTYSPLFSYYLARKIRGWEQEDSGAMIRDIVKAMATDGAAPETSWPYDVRRFATPPSKTATKQATRWRLGSYYRCEGLDRVTAAISQSLPVVGGFSVYSSMLTSEVDRTGVVPMPTKRDRLVGGHAVLFTGFDYVTGYVEFKNSWGAWGDAGYGYLPVEYLNDDDLSDDFWALTGESEASFRGEAPKP